MAHTRVLVTGAGGFIGSHLVEDQLRRGRQVTALDVNLDRLGHLRGRPDCRLVVGDIRDQNLLRPILTTTDIVFHLASAHLEVGKPDSYFFSVNVEAIRALVDTAGRCGIARFVHCSSVGVYGPLQALPADEDTECHPDILYEKTKLEGEKMVREGCASTGLSAVVLRPAWVYGPRCPRTLKLFRTIAKKRFFMVGDGRNFRHPLFITDMLEAFESAGSYTGENGNVFIIASAEPVRLRELVERIIEAQELSYQPISLPYGLVRAACAVAEGSFSVLGREPPFSTRSLKFFTDSASFRIDKAEKLLGFQPRVGLKEGLQRTLAYYRQHALL